MSAAVPMPGIDGERRWSGLYVARLDLHAPHLLGVAAKVRAQRDALSERLGPVGVVFPSEGSIWRDDQAVREFGKGSTWHRLVYYVFFYFVVAGLARGADFLYLRYQGASPFFLSMLWLARRHDPSIVIVVEIPTFPYDDAAITLRAKALLLVDRMWRRLAFRYVDRVVTFSGDDRIFGVPTVRTTNGVDVEGIAPLEPRVPGPELRLVGVANVSYWHGYDRIVLGLRDYYARGGRMDVTFDVVGTGADLPALKALVEQSGLQDRVRFHGSLRGRALDDLLGTCQVGISCVALHRKRSDTSDLKSREYCARGLPFVIGYADRDFGGDLPFVHHVARDDTPIDIAALLDFHARLVAEHPMYRARMRGFASERLTWREKMRPVVDMLLALLAGKRALP